ncbi:hypothetical protein B0H16DRAFT_1891299 [Mycena metata]|uniref:Uncharacterized protein n=1 Tax=Mycena metata TaxID=1033252 RepID=A0AAD7IAD6_9AGAR|nr:hypothetical protein B0H16DRAFT_1891299 [Mycena metata]
MNTAFIADQVRWCPIIDWAAASARAYRARSPSRGPSAARGGATTTEGHRASSVQAFFSPSLFSNTAYTEHHHHQEEDEELPDEDTSLFETRFLDSFGAPASASASPVSDPIRLFGRARVAATATDIACPQPVRPVSPLGVEFAESQGYEPTHYLDEPTASSSQAPPTRMHTRPRLRLRYMLKTKSRGACPS